MEDENASAHNNEQIEIALPREGQRMNIGAEM